MPTEEQAKGVLLGLACGDALGRPVEFSTRRMIDEEHGQLTNMVGDGTWNKPAGTVTDDTDQALCIAQSIVEREAFDPDDIAQRFVDWYESDPFDIGNMTGASLRQLRDGVSWQNAGHVVWEEREEGNNAGNGSVMRCAPIALVFGPDDPELRQTSMWSSEITHADPRCQHACSVLNETIARIVDGQNKPLETTIDRLPETTPSEVVTALEEVANETVESGAHTSGYVVETLKHGLSDALTASSAEEAIVAAVNRGGDTDTVGAVAGAVAGARFGVGGLPGRWTSELNRQRELIDTASQLAAVEPPLKISEQAMRNQ